MSEYTHKDIKTIDELIDHIRQNVGMYAGETETPLHLFEECFTNSLDEAIAGYANIIAININTEENIYEIVDNGRGIPIDNDVPISISTKFSGGKFKNSKTAYIINSGRHGVGLVVVNALSSFYQIEVYRDKKYARFKFNNGKIEENIIEKYNDKVPFSTRICFKPDEKYFNDKKIPFEKIRNRLLTASVELPECTFVLNCDNKREVIKLDRENFFKNNCLNNDNEYTDIIEIEAKDKYEKFDILLSYSKDGPVSQRILTSLNVLPVEGGGTHVNVFTNILKDVLTTKAKKLGYKIQPQDVLIRLRAYLSLYLEDSEFGGQTKEKLTNRIDYFDKLGKKIKKSLEDKLQKNEDILIDILETLHLYRKNIESRKFKNKANGKKRGSTKFTKLKDCSSIHGELFVTEGDSACFTGDSEILDINLNSFSFYYMYNNFDKQTFYTFSSDKDGRIHPTKIIDCFISKYVDKLVKIIFDNNEEVKCTPDHKFMLRDGSYKYAKDLTKEDSLMPLYYNKDKIYNQIKCNHNNVFENVYSISSTHKDSDDDVSMNNDYINIHHKDKNPKNDYPTNLIKLDQNIHLKIHCNDISEEDRIRVAKIASKTLHQKRLNDPEYDKIYRDKLKKTRNTDEYLKHHSEIHKISMNKPEVKEILRIKANEQWSNPENRKKKSEDVKQFYKNNPDAHRKSSIAATISCCKRWHKNHPENCSKCKDKYLKLKNNHKIKSIEFIHTFNEPVYDIVVDNENHNFPLKSGVFVHNSGTLTESRDPSIHAILPLKGKIPSIMNKETVLKNKETKELIQTLGTGIGSDFDITKLRYNKIIGLMDADPDGSHIFVLLAMILYNLVPEIIKQGHFYLARTPLRAINEKNIFIPLWTTEEYEEALRNNRNITRFKGLGELNPWQLKICALDESTRRLIQVQYPEDGNSLMKLFEEVDEKRKLLTNDDIELFQDV